VVWQGSAGDRRPYADLTRYSEVGRSGGGAKMVLPGETEAALRGRNHAEG
jgi:hypothetical protein